MLLVRVCGSRQNFYIFGVYRNPSTDDMIFDCLLSSMSEIQSVDRKAVFSFVGDFNCRHEKWLHSPRTDAHGRAARDFCDLADGQKLVNGSLTGMEVPWTWS